MFVFLMLPVLTCGFLVLSRSLPHFYKLHRLEGQYLYIKCALHGVYCLAIATFLTLSMSNIIPDKICYLSLDLHNLIETFIKSVVNDSDMANELSWFIIITITMYIVRARSRSFTLT